MPTHRRWTASAGTDWINARDHHKESGVLFWEGHHRGADAHARADHRVAGAHGGAQAVYGARYGAVVVDGWDAMPVGAPEGAAQDAHREAALGAHANAAVARDAHTANALGASGNALRSTPTRLAPRRNPARACWGDVRPEAAGDGRTGGRSRFRCGRSGRGGIRLRRASPHNRKAARLLPAQRPSAQVKRRRWQKSAT